MTSNVGHLLWSGIVSEKRARTLLGLDVVDGKLRSRPYRSDTRAPLRLKGVKVGGRRLDV
jgi:hypothetical protein